MEQIDLTKLNTAIIYLQRIADGNNPTNNRPMGENSILNNPNVVRCMYFAKEVLEKVRNNDGYIGRKPQERIGKPFPDEALQAFTYREDLPLPRFIQQVNSGIDSRYYQRFSLKPIQDWLIVNEYLQAQFSEDSRQAEWLPTEKGNLIGIQTEKKSSYSGKDYLCAVYTKPAQEMIAQNMRAIIVEATGKNPWAKPFPVESVQSFSYKEDKTISKFVSQLNEEIDPVIYRRLNYKPITDWLKANCYLRVEFDRQSNTKRTVSTEKGKNLGISETAKIGKNGNEYTVIVYGKQAQEYIVQNLARILDETERLNSD